ncbi:MAG TPA: nitrite reductase small subunit NirD [Egibacteraceae bacterium]|nr:nitrite reductase small subunit NirD [Egibacteraceae bacterium]
MSGVWIPLCALDDIVPDSGVCARVGGRQVAVFRLRDGDVHAVGNVDPFSGAAVLSRGILGDVAGVPVVASPVYKERFDLRTGTCLDDPAVRIPVYDVRLTGGVIEVAEPEPAPSSASR